MMPLHCQEDGCHRLMAITSQHAKENGAIGNQSLFREGKSPWSLHHTSLWM